jgi:amidophosphoribosyltransferase
MMNLQDDKLHEECGVFGIYGHPEAARMTYLGMYALQHRGQESCGIVASNGEQLLSEREMGYVSEVFDQARLDRLAGTSAIGHVRYSTAGEVSIRECQPFLVRCQHGQIAICHNGNLPRRRRAASGRPGRDIFNNFDTEVILHGGALARRKH